MTDKTLFMAIVVLWTATLNWKGIKQYLLTYGIYKLFDNDPILKVPRHKKEQTLLSVVDTTLYTIIAVLFVFYQLETGYIHHFIQSHNTIFQIMILIEFALVLFNNRNLWKYLPDLPTANLLYVLLVFTIEVSVLIVFANNLIL